MLNFKIIAGFGWRNWRDQMGGNRGEFGWPCCSPRAGVQHRVTRQVCGGLHLQPHQTQTWQLQASMGPPPAQHQNLRVWRRYRLPRPPLHWRRHVYHVSFARLLTKSFWSHGVANHPGDEEIISDEKNRVLVGSAVDLEYRSRCFSICFLMNLNPQYGLGIFQN